MLAKKGPSRALAGEGEREPGMGSRAPCGFFVGGQECKTVSRRWDATVEVSQVSKPESCDGRAVVEFSKEELREKRV